MDFCAEQILTIAFDESGDIVIEQNGHKSKAVANHAKVQRDRLKVDSLKWIASRLFPKRYGDKMGQADEPKSITYKLAGLGAIQSLPSRKHLSRLSTASLSCLAT